MVCSLLYGLSGPTQQTPPLAFLSYLYLVFGPFLSGHVVLCHNITSEEVKQVVFYMCPLKVSDSKGLRVFFYQKY